MDDITLNMLAREVMTQAAWIRGEHGPPQNFGQEIAAINFGVGVIKERDSLDLEQVIMLLQKLQQNREAGLLVTQNKAWVADLVARAVTPN